MKTNCSDWLCNKTQVGNDALNYFMKCACAISCAQPVSSVPNVERRNRSHLSTFSSYDAAPVVSRFKAGFGIQLLPFVHSITGMPKEKYDPPDPRRMYTIMSSEEAANGKKSYWAELEISGECVGAGQLRLMLTLRSVNS